MKNNKNKKEEKVENHQDKSKNKLDI